MAVLALVSACGSGDRDQIVEQVIQLSDNGDYGVFVDRSCLEFKVDQLSTTDLALMTPNGEESMSPFGQAISEELWQGCIDLGGYREQTIRQIAAADSTVDLDCLQFRFPNAETFQEIDEAVVPTSRFCRTAG